MEAKPNPKDENSGEVLPGSSDLKDVLQLMENPAAKLKRGRRRSSQEFESGQTAIVILASLTVNLMHSK